MKKRKPELLSTKFKKIIITIIIFCVLIFILCLGISLIAFLNAKIAFSDIFSQAFNYFLYTIGYGSLEDETFLQNFLAMIGIVSLALMSTYLTINLFWRLDDVILDEDINYKNNELIFTIINKGRDICNVNIKFFLYNAKAKQNQNTTREYDAPIIMKKSSWSFEASLDDTFWYQTVKNILRNNEYQVYASMSFVDMKSGQESIKLIPITAGNIIGLTLAKLNNPVVFNTKDINLIANNNKLELNNKVLTYKINSNDTFLMAYYSFDNLNLNKYDDKSYLEWNLKSIKEAIIVIEIKSGVNKLLAYQSKYTLNDNFTKIKIPLNELKGNREEIKEICLTIFTNDNKYLENSIVMSDLKLIVK